MRLASRLTGLSPFGPIFGKELRTTARRKRTYILRFLYLGLLLLWMWAIYLDTRPSRYYDRATGVAYRAQKAAEMGHAFFAAFTGFCIITLTLIAPVLTATSISSERQSKTLNVLLMTPITAWQIISGKLMSRMLAAFTLLGLSLPVLSVVRLLGGVDLDRMLWVVVLCLVTSLFSAAIGLFYSTFMNRAYAVILLSYATLLVLYLFVPFLVVMLLENNRSLLRSGGFIDFLGAINPMVTAIFGVAMAERPFRGISPVPTIVLHLIATFLLMLWSSATLRKVARRQGESAGGVSATDPVLAMALSGMVGHDAITEVAGGGDGWTIDMSPAASPSSGGRNVSDNPVLWREMRRSLTSRPWQAKLFTVLSIGLLLLSYLALSGRNGNIGDARTQVGYSLIFCGLLTLITCVISATAIAGEKESDTWILLLATPLTARAIVLGKLAGQFRRLLWPALLIVGHFAVFTLTGVISFACFFVVLWIIFIFNVIWIATGLYFSLRVGKTTLAVTFNLLMPISAYMLAAIVLLILGNLAGDRGEWVDVVAWYAPYGYLYSAVRGFDTYRYSNAMFYLPYGGHGSVDTWTFIEGVLQVSLVYVTLSAGIVYYVIKRFDRIVGRSA